MQKVRYIGGSDNRILTTEDLTLLGIEDHPGLWWSSAEPVVEVEDEHAEVLLANKREFKREASDEELAENLVEEKSREDLYEEAKALGLTGLSKAGKEEIAEAIVARQAEMDDAALSAISEGVPSSDEGAQTEPHA